MSREALVTFEACFCRTERANLPSTGSGRSTKETSGPPQYGAWCPRTLPDECRSFLPSPPDTVVSTADTVSSMVAEGFKGLNSWIRILVGTGIFGVWYCLMRCSNLHFPDAIYRVGLKIFYYDAKVQQGSGGRVGYSVLRTLVRQQEVVSRQQGVSFCLIKLALLG